MLPESAVEHAGIDIPRPQTRDDPLPGQTEKDIFSREAHIKELLQKQHEEESRLNGLRAKSIDLIKEIEKQEENRKACNHGIDFLPDFCHAFYCFQHDLSAKPKR